MRRQVFFIAYIAFSQFAVLNVVTGVFCQTAIEGSSAPGGRRSHA